MLCSAWRILSKDWRAVMIPMDMGIMDLLDLYKYKNKRCRQKTTDFDTITIIIYENLKKGRKK